MRRLAPLGLAILIAATSCGGSRAGTTSGDVLVFAAASLTESFTDIGAAFRRANPGAHVRFNFGPSDGLATGIGEGGRADVFASASARYMDVVAGSPGVSGRVVFARNRLVVIVPSAVGRITAFADLARPGVKLVVAASSVPAGTYARQALADAHLDGALRNIVSNEIDVKGVVQKMVLGEADAGIVYATDLTPAVSSKVRAVAIPDDVNVIASYPIAVVTGAPHPAAAREFVRFVLGPGRAILLAAGFLPPA